MNNTHEPTPPRWQQLIVGILAHLLCYGISICAMYIAVLLTWNDESGGPPRALPWIGLTYWLVSGIWVWWLWGRRPRTVIPIFATTLAAMLLVSAGIGHRWRLAASSVYLQMFVWGLAVSPSRSWSRGSRREARVGARGSPTPQRSSRRSQEASCTSSGRDTTASRAPSSTGSATARHAAGRRLGTARSRPAARGAWGPRHRRKNPAKPPRPAQPDLCTPRPTTTSPRHRQAQDAPHNDARSSNGRQQQEGTGDGQHRRVSAHKRLLPRSK